MNFLNILNLNRTKESKMSIMLNLPQMSSKREAEQKANGSFLPRI